MHRIAFISAWIVTSTPALASPRLKALSALDRIERATGRRPEVVWRTGRPAPELVAGRLSAPSGGSPAVVAGRFLAAHPELVRAPLADLRPTRLLRTVGGHVVRYQQWHRGLPVFNAEVTVTVDDSGVVRAVAGTTRSIPLQDLTPTLDARAALGAAQLHAPVAGATANAQRARLGLYALPGGIVLAYRVVLPAVPALLEAPTVYVDAHDGRLLRKVSRIWFARSGRVYMPNPVVSPEPRTVALSWLPATPTTLSSERVEAVNCIDNHNTTPVTVQGFTLNVHTCDEIHKAQSSGAPEYDFLFDPIDDGSAAANEDAFAEVQMFYHANRIYDFYRSLGFDTLIDSQTGVPGPLQATVNFRIPIDLRNPPQNLFAAIQQATDPNGPLYPFDNAFFLDAQSASTFLSREHDSMIFGQGATDFAYDGDVIYHEFGHAVVASTSRLTSALVDSFGLDSAPGAMNEGYSDYFAAALSNDPSIGEYAGSALPAGQVSGAIRTLVGSDTCPEHLWGEVHQDSQAFSAALWQARSGVAEADRAKYDAAVYAAMAALPSEASFEAAATATLAQIRAKLGAAAESAARTVYQNRGLMGCNHRIVPYSAPRRLTFIEGTGTVGLTPYVPGYTQLRFELAAGKNEILVSYVPRGGLPTPQSGFDFGAAPNLVLLVARDTPIEFVYEGTAIGNTRDFIEVAPRETTQTTTQGKIWEARLAAVPGTYYLMLVNKGQGQGVVANLKVEARTATATPDGGTTPTFDGGTPGNDGGTLPGSDGGSGGAPRSGGGCSAGGAGAPGLLPALFAALALLLRRRRP